MQKPNSFTAEMRNEVADKIDNKEWLLLRYDLMLIIKTIDNGESEGMVQRRME
jgi:hypothetical protein